MDDQPRLTPEEALTELLHDEGIKSLEEMTDEQLESLTEKCLFGDYDGTSPALCVQCRAKMDYEPDAYGSDCRECGAKGTVYALVELVLVNLG